MEKIKSSLTNRRNWLAFAEYASIAGSAVGSVISALSGQVAFAAFPLTLAVSLNVINRARMTGQVLPELAPVNAITSSFDELFPFAPTPDLFDSPALQEEVAELRRLLTDLQANTTLGLMELQQQLAEQKPGVGDASGVDLNSIYQSIFELQGMTERLENTTLKEDDSERFNVQVFLIKEALAELKKTIAELPQGGNLAVNFSEIQLRLAQMQADEQIQMNEILKRVAQLEQRNREIVKPYLQRLVSEVKQLRQQVEKIRLSKEG